MERATEKKERGMSRHSSFGGSGKIKVKRNVLKRYERIDVLKTRGKWKEGDKALGLAKTKVTG
jgi:small basic protein (TIGR04137 family)